MAYRFVDTARDTAGNPVSGVTGELRVKNGGALVKGSTTVADGKFAYTEAEVGYPGPTDFTATGNGVTIKHGGDSTGQVGPIWFSDLTRAFRMMTDGVIGGVDGELAVTADGVGRDVDVAIGGAFNYGLPFYNPAIKNVAIAENLAVDPRIDRIIIRSYPPGTLDEGKQDLVVLQGTPAASPSPPTVTKNAGTVWETSLAQVLVEPGVSVITNAKITDERTYTSGPLMDSSVTSAKILDGTIATADLANNAVTSAKMSSGASLSTAALVQVLKAPTSGSTPNFATLALTELSNVNETAPADNQVLVYDTGTNQWGPETLGTLTITVQEGDVTVDANVTTLDFDASDFNVTSSPSGEANIALAYGTGAGTPAEGNHTHTSAIEVRRANVVTVAAATMLNFGTQFVVTEAPAAGNATIVANTGATVNHLAAGSHVHEGYPTLFAYLESDTTRQVTGTLADVESVTIGPLANGVTYDLEVTVDMRASLDSGGGYVVAYARIGADSSVAGTQTGTTGGERTIRSFASKSAVVGDGVSSVTLYARAQMQGGGTDGSVQATTIIGRAHPRTVQVLS